eukprot:TRINITY_DN5524_c0_g1_i1.p1 TRINITY_DN5524_c0_g1~~TRINITY_DN5524_c0_g1_i1.p1  ORF type:complete len:134 (+),score=35.32 TRINITY_DN5524_c0_g1_i1:303-704(+)
MDKVVGTGTALHYATCSGLLFCVMALLKNGADKEMKFQATPDFKKWNGKTALEIATMSENRDIVTVLTHGPVDVSDDKIKLQEEILGLKLQIGEMQEKFAVIVATLDEQEKNLKEINRFVKGEQKRKYYARKM